MKKIKMILTGILVISFFLNINLANTGEDIKKARKLVNEGIIKWNEGQLFQASSLCERIYSVNENPYAKYYQTLAQAYILQKAMVDKNNEKFHNFFDAAVENAKSLTDNPELKDEAEVLLAHMYMSKLSVAQDEAPALVGKFYSCIEKALKINPENPRAIVLKGIMLFYTPEMFGGDVIKAIELLEKAKPLYKKNLKNELSPNWGYVDMMCTLGMAYTKKEDYQKALNTYNEALKTVPGYGRIQHQLLPEVEKKIKAGK